MTQPRKPSWTDQQAGKYERFVASLKEAKPPLPEPTQVFLRALREYQLRGDLLAQTLARRAAEREKARHHGVLPKGRKAWVGHDKDGAFSAQRLSAELSGQEGLPRPELVEVVAEAYAARSGEDETTVLARLQNLQAVAETAVAAAKEAEREEALRSNNSPPTYGELKTVRRQRDEALVARDAARSERDELRGQLDRVDAQLEQLQARQRELLDEDRERAQSAGRLEQRVAELTARDDTLRNELAERRREMAASLRDQETVRAERDQLQGWLDRVRHQLEELQERHAQLRVEDQARAAATHSLELRVAELTARSETLHNELTRRDNELAASRAENQALITENDQLTGQVKELSEQAAALRDEQADGARALAESRARNTELDNNAMKLRHELDQREAELDRREKEVAQLTEQLAQERGVRQDPRPDSTGAAGSTRGRHAAPEALPSTLPSSAHGYRTVSLPVTTPPEASSGTNASAGPPTQTLIEGVDDDLVEDVINDLQRGRLYDSELGRAKDSALLEPVLRRAPQSVVVEVYAAGARYLESPLRDLVADWDIRWAGLSTWHYGWRLSWRWGITRWMLALRLPLLAAAVLVAAFKPPVTALASGGLPWVGTLQHPVIVTSPWAPVAVAGATALLVGPSLAHDRLAHLPYRFRLLVLAAITVGFAWPLALLVLTIMTPASWLDLRELGTSWCRYLPALAVLVSALALSSHTPARRYLPASVVAVLAAAAIGVGWWWPGWSAERGPISSWFVLGAVTLLICLGLGVWRHQERFFRYVSRRVPHVKASEALIERLNQAVRFERRDSPPPGYTVAPAHSSELNRRVPPFTITMDEPDRVSVGYHGLRESRQISQPPSILVARTLAATPDQLHISRYNAPGRTSYWFTIQRSLDRQRTVTDTVWLCDEGDAVREGDPIAVTAAVHNDRQSRRDQTYELHWLLANRDGVIVQLSPGAGGRHRPPGHALIRPTSHPFSALPVPPANPPQVATPTEAV